MHNLVNYLPNFVQVANRLNPHITHALTHTFVVEEKKDVCVCVSICICIRVLRMYKCVKKVFLWLM